MTTSTTSTPQKRAIRIAIPVVNGRLYGHFGGAREFALIEVDPDLKAALRIEVMPAPEHQPGAFPRWLRERGVAVVIADGIGKRALANFASHGITVCAGVPDTGVQQLVAAYLNGQLTLAPDGCEHHGHRHHTEPETNKGRSHEQSNTDPRIE